MANKPAGRLNRFPATVIIGPILAQDFCDPRIGQREIGHQKPTWPGTWWTLKAHCARRRPSAQDLPESWANNHASGASAL